MNIHGGSRIAREIHKQLASSHHNLFGTDIHTCTPNYMYIHMYMNTQHNIMAYTHLFDLHAPGIHLQVHNVHVHVHVHTCTYTVHVHVHKV